VQPALADPEHKILKPVQAFLGQQAAAAAERRRRSYPRRANHANGDTSTSSTASAAASTSASTNIFQQPAARILRLFIVALVLAQVLETTGILDNAGSVNQKLLAAWEKHAQPHWEDLNYHVQDWTHNVRHWWRAARQTGTGLLSATTWSDPVLLSNSWQKQVSPKYQTAVGLGIGMVCAPFLWTAGEGLLKTGVGAYLVSEVVHLILESQFTFWWQDQEQEEEDTWFTRPAFSFGGMEPDGDGVASEEWELDIAIRDLLETWRQTVRDTVQSLRQGRDDDGSGSYRYSFRSSKQRQTDTGSLFPPHMRSGVIIGTVIGVLVGA
jgi:hypothetical protein